MGTRFEPFEIIKQFFVNHIYSSVNHAFFKSISRQSIPSVFIRFLYLLVKTGVIIMEIKTFGSVCSGIEAASVSFNPLGMKTQWVSEIAPFQSKFLSAKYPDVPNLGDMTDVPQMLFDKKIEAPDMICGGTPCQAFSLTGYRKGLLDDRGNLTLKYIDIINANDKVRLSEKKNKTIMLWENVEGVLSDKTNAFGCFVSFLAGLENPIEYSKWATAGVIWGKERNVAWRVIDAKFFGVPQQRKRLYVMAGGKEFHPEDILFEIGEISHPRKNAVSLSFRKGGHSFEVFREYTDCLYAAYGTKWNGNAAAYNGSLFVVQDGDLRRLTPLECERLMGFPDDYTNIFPTKVTNRFQAVGNSWAVPVIKWIGERLVSDNNGASVHDLLETAPYCISNLQVIQDAKVFTFGKDFTDGNLNCSFTPCNIRYGNIHDVVSFESERQLFLSPVACGGILRRKRERNMKMNERLEIVMQEICDRMHPDEIEKISRKQPRGAFSLALEKEST